MFRREMLQGETLVADGMGGDATARDISPWDCDDEKSIWFFNLCSD